MDLDASAGPGGCEEGSVADPGALRDAAQNLLTTGQITSAAFREVIHLLRSRQVQSATQRLMEATVEGVHVQDAAPNSSSVRTCRA